MLKGCWADGQNELDARSQSPKVRSENGADSFDLTGGLFDRNAVFDELATVFA